MTNLPLRNNKLTGSGYTITAQSMIVARYNLAGNKIGVVWHYYEADNTHTDVRIATLDLSAVPIQWINVRTVNHNSTGNDQWNPAIDYDNSGNALVAWYDRRDTPTTYFLMYGTKVSSTGGQIDTLDKALTSITADAQLCVSAYSGNYEVGEYQDVWFWQTYWRLGHIYAPRGTNVGVYFSGALP